MGPEKYFLHAAKCCPEDPEMRGKTFNGIEKQLVTKALTSLKKRKPQPEYTVLG